MEEEYWKQTILSAGLVIVSLIATVELWGDESPAGVIMTAVALVFMLVSMLVFWGSFNDLRHLLGQVSASQSGRNELEVSRKSIDN